MAQFETVGSAVQEANGSRVERKVVISTDGANPTAPGGTGRLTNINITTEPGGVRRGIFEYTQGGGGETGGGATYNQYGKKVELMGGSREIPIYNHPNFASLTKEQIFEVQEAVEEREDRNFDDENQQKLFQFLSRGTEYFLAPSVVARVSEIETGLPSVSGLCNVADPNEASAPAGTFWVLTGISATPLGNAFEVTREYTSVPAAWDDVEFLYNNW